MEIPDTSTGYTALQAYQPKLRHCHILAILASLALCLPTVPRAAEAPTEAAGPSPAAGAVGNDTRLLVIQRRAVASSSGRREQSMAASFLP